MGDFNGDGKADLFVNGYFGGLPPVGGTPSGAFFEGNGDGTFQIVMTPPNYTNSILTTADFNGDGKADLAVAGEIWLGNGNGTFHEAGSYLVGTGQLAVADFNGDGKPDLASIDTVNDSVDVFRGNGDGTFQSPVSWVAGSSFPQLLAAGDFNGDGKADILSSLDYASGGHNQFTVLLGSGSVTPIVGPPATITATAGSGQSATVNTPFAAALTVVVEDASGNLVPNASVIFTAPSTGASLSVVTSTATTNAGSGQGTTVKTPFGTALTVVVEDASGNLVPNASVTFTAPSTGASLSAATSTATTNASGVASLSATANAVAGAFTVIASSGAATSASFNLTNNAGAPAAITATGGTPQSATVGTAFAAPLQAAVKDQYGNPVSGAPVTFTAPSTGASLSAATSTATTNASGLASLNATANTVAGTFTVVASTGAATTASFSLTNNGGAAAGITATAGSGQSASVGTAFGTALTVLVKDAFGNPVPNAAVTFSVTAGMASLGSAQIQTGANGSAQTTVTPESTGAITVSATTGAVSTPALFQLTGTPASQLSVLPSTLTFTAVQGGPNRLPRRSRSRTRPARHR